MSAWLLERQEQRQWKENVVRKNGVFDARKTWNRRRLTFQLTGTLRGADFGLGFQAQNWTAAKCPVERRVRRHPRKQLEDGKSEFKAH